MTGQSRNSAKTWRIARMARFGLFAAVLCCSAAFSAVAAPYAAMVMDARSGEVLHSRNADTRLHPASLTKMMTVYVAFEAVKRGEISLDTKVRVSRKAATEPPSKLGLKAGQQIQLRYLIRASAIKSANDAATALAEAISGSEAAFARRMTRTARSMGMSRTTFKNAHGLTQSGHRSTARDMTILGRHLFYDFPEYYNLFARRSTSAGVRRIKNTNQRLLDAYAGADGIKTGYTRAAGFNLVASAGRQQERIIVTLFGGRSVSTRNAKVAQLLDMGFERAPSSIAVRRPEIPAYEPNDEIFAKAVYALRAVKRSPIPETRPGSVREAPTGEFQVATADILEATKDYIGPRPLLRSIDEMPVAEGSWPAAEIADQDQTPWLSVPFPRLRSRQALAAASDAEAPESGRAVTSVSTSGGRHWSINMGRFKTRYQAERALISVALADLGALDTALRKVISGSQGHDANFIGLTKDEADQACLRLEARGIECRMLGPT